MPRTGQATASPPAPSLEYARILRREGDTFVAAASFGEVRARAAASCLLEPSPGDTVLLSLDLTGRTYVLAVLESAASPRVALRGDATLSAQGGSLTIASDADVTLRAPGTLEAACGGVNVRAVEAAADIRDMRVAGTALSLAVERLNAVAVNMDLSVQRLTQRAGESSRFVSGHDELQAGSARVLVEDACALHARNHSIIAEEQVVMNAQQIHMG